jgi:hypothetical protein
MKKKLLILSAAIVTMAVLGFFALYIWIDADVRKNIKTAKEKYSGNAEDALVAYLLDTTNTYQDRTSIAIWTLGQIQSQKALPILKGLYRNDPEGKTCYGRHDSVLCQYGIYKAIKAAESDWWPMHARLK